MQGLVNRMLLLQRLFYILDARQPQAPTVLSILNILTRVARHSVEMAYEVQWCPFISVMSTTKIKRELDCKRGGCW